MFSKHLYASSEPDTPATAPAPAPAGRTPLQQHAPCCSKPQSEVIRAITLEGSPYLTARTAWPARLRAQLRPPPPPLGRPARPAPTRPRQLLIDHNPR